MAGTAANPDDLERQRHHRGEHGILFLHSPRLRTRLLRRMPPRGDRRALLPESTTENLPSSLEERIRPRLLRFSPHPGARQEIQPGGEGQGGQTPLRWLTE